MKDHKKKKKKEVKKMMDKKLKTMFDYQRFSGNKMLESMLHDAESRYPRALSDDELDLVAAAGKPGEKDPDKENN